MRYPIGRISKFLGLSTETIRTYERKGIVHPQKNENGYRTFHVLDIGTLLRCRSYSCFGLSLSEAADAINCNSVAETHALLVKQEKWLKKQTDYNLRMLNRLNDLNEVMSTCEREINRLSVVQHPGMFRVDYRHNDELLSGDAREDLLALWASFAPFSFVSLKFPLESIQRAEQDYFCGYGILEEDALLRRVHGRAGRVLSRFARRSHHPQGGWGRFRSDSYAHPASGLRSRKPARPHGGRVYAHGGHHQAKRAGL